MGRNKDSKMTEDRIKVGLDMDGVYAAGFKVDKPFIIISGRDVSEFSQTVRQVGGNIAIYLRTKGKFGNGELAGEHKAGLINLFGIEEFYEDDHEQGPYIKANCPNCKVFKVINGQLVGEW